MVISTRKMSKRTQEPVDQWLAKEGYFRKPTPKDPTCLFRAISEQVYHTQHYHLRVRKECTEFMRKKRHLFTDSIMMSFDYYLKEMQCFTEWGGPNEIRAMSLLYKRDIIIFIGEKQICENVTNNGFKKGVMLLCHTEARQYEPVYPMAFVQSAAYCQSIVYEVVYRYMYQMPNINTVADKMLHNRSSTYRHDKFFQKGNLDIREQLIEDLYKKVKNEPDDTDDTETQFDWKEGPPIPYKVAKALAPDYYRNIELDIWHELKREVKSAGWNRYNSNELQVGGKCLIEISVNDLEQCDGNNNRNIRINNSLDCAASESNSNIEQQKLKQGALWLHGYIQEMNTDKEPVLVFIKDLGEKKFVPYDALKPLPVVRKNRQKSWVPINRNHTVNPDSNRRWKKSYNSFSRKRKDTIGITNVTADNTNVLISIHNDDDSGNVDGVNNINKSDFETDEHNEKFPKTERQMSENNSACSNDTSNEEIDSLSTALVTLDNSKSTTSNNAVQEVVDKHRKTDAVFRKANNNAKNKTEKCNNFGNGNKNSCSKPKALDENYCPTYNGNSQMLVGDNLNVSYIAPDNNNMYTIYSYPPGNFGEQTLNQVDHSITSSFFYNLHLLHIEDSFRLNPTYYGPMMYGPGHHGVQPVGALPNAHVPYIQEEMERLVNGMQNLSLTCGEGVAGASAESCNTSHMSMSGMQNAGQPKQGPKISNGKDFLCQVPQKGKQTGTAKGNKARNRQQNPRGPAAYPQHSNYQYGATMMSGSRGNAYDARRHDVHALQSQQQQQQQHHHWDPSGVHQMVSMATTNPSNSYPPPNICPNMQYHEFSPPYEGGVGNSAYYLGNGNYIQPVPYLSAQHIENAAENAAVPSYPQHFYPTTENYPPSHPLATGQPMVYPPPMIYPPPIQYHALPPPPHMQEQWNPTTLGPQTYVQCPAQQPIVEPSSNGQVVNLNGSP